MAIHALKTIGLIPARGGSKRLRRKNLRLLGNRSLLSWAIEAGLAAEDYLDRLAVSSEDNEILAEARAYNDVDVITRPAELATDAADSYVVMLHALDWYDEHFDLLVLLQPTSPFRHPGDISGCIEKWFELGLPAVASFEEGAGVPNGAVYVGDTQWLRDGGNFDSAGVGRYDMSSWRSLDIDTEEDMATAEARFRELVEGE